MASKPDLNELSKALTTANPAQLKTLQIQISGLLSLGEGPKAPTATDDWLWDGFVTELVSRGLLHSNAAGTLQRTKAFKTYTASAAQVRALLLRGAPGLEQNRTVLRAFGQRVAYCLAEALSEWAVVSPALMLTRVAEIPAAVDQCFPGYRESGLLGKLVTVSAVKSA